MKKYFSLWLFILIFLSSCKLLVPNLASIKLEGKENSGQLPLTELIIVSDEPEEDDNYEESESPEETEIEKDTEYAEDTNSESDTDFTDDTENIVDSDALDGTESFEITEESDNSEAQDNDETFSNSESLNESNTENESESAENSETLQDSDSTDNQEPIENQEANDSQVSVENAEPSDSSDNPENLDSSESTEESPVPESPVIKPWSILIYMPADNNLEPEAINDLCEIEMSKFDTEENTILALVDRNPGYDASNGNWYNTRLYKMSAGKETSTKTLISEEIDCEPLGLIKGGNVELDMSSSYVLSDSLKFMKEKFPAEHYGLIMWGHGTGWRGDQVEKTSGFRALAFDSTTGSYMNLKQFEKALNDGLGTEPLDFIGFDTCFGQEFEILYEIQNYAKYCVGSEGLVLSSGWNYEKLFTAFSMAQEQTAEIFCKTVVQQYSDLYQYNSGSSISVFDLRKTQEIFFEFEEFMKLTSQFVKKATIRDKVINEIYQKLIMYSEGAAGSDVYYDMLEMVMTIELGLQIFESENQALFTKIHNQSIKLQEMFYEAVPFYWSYDSVCPGVGIFFGTLSESGLFASTHPNGYVKGKTLNQINFVINSNWYVPQKKAGESFLDKLFYTRIW